MTYQELLKETAEKKRKAIRELNTALRGKAGFLVKAEIERNPGKVAWLWLAQEFCESIAEHLSELTESAEEYEKMEISSIYMAYEDSDPGLYEMLPVEAQLFTEEA